MTGWLLIIGTLHTTKVWNVSWPTTVRKIDTVLPKRTWMIVTHLASHFNSRIIIQGARTILAVYSTSRWLLGENLFLPRLTTKSITVQGTKFRSESILLTELFVRLICLSNGIESNLNDDDSAAGIVLVKWTRFQTISKTAWADKHESERWLPWLGRSRAYFFTR